jgi:hypothetical protein
LNLGRWHFGLFPSHFSFLFYFPVFDRSCFDFTFFSPLFSSLSSSLVSFSSFPVRPLSLYSFLCSSSLLAFWPAGLSSAVVQGSWTHGFAQRWLKSWARAGLGELLLAVWITGGGAARRKTSDG